MWICKSKIPSLCGIGKPDAKEACFLEEVCLTKDERATSFSSIYSTQNWPTHLITTRWNCNVVGKQCGL